MLIMLVGLPSVGKSTFSKNLSKKLSEKNFDNIILGTDLIRESFPVWKEKYEDYIKKMNNYLISEALNEGFTVIIDDTNYYNSKRRDLMHMANSKNKNCISIYLKAPLDVLLTRNIARGAKIPNSVIEDMYSKFDEMGTKYKWDKPDLEINTHRDDINFEEVANKIIELNNIKTKNKELEKDVKKDNYSSNNNKNIDDIDELLKEFKNRVDVETRHVMGEFIKNNKNLSKNTIKELSNYRKNYIKNIKKIVDIEIKEYNSDLDDYALKYLEEFKKELKKII
ncbi:L-seryl-tRNA(Sec) kinase [Methanococcus voltae]|uniref:L-seryl-tRNA(Sec) kinase n=1 Tax=Methanococcus voltae (strain ATCC BAA-1334 / A3) TaxID=456320 RepID=D7DQY8_METV3|nr:L-seryl-tRNA(Sec) kinase [Methanococcus voltae]MCS3900925.1 O-phosphoseryl-tRNA(Sec) kinase [Methanococcus voltae]